LRVCAAKTALLSCAEQSSLSVRIGDGIFGLFGLPIAHEDHQ
jgi:hypothetical protein